MKSSESTVELLIEAGLITQPQIDKAWAAAAEKKYVAAGCGTCAHQGSNSAIYPCHGCVAEGRFKNFKPKQAKPAVLPKLLNVLDYNTIELQKLCLAVNDLTRWLEAQKTEAKLEKSKS